MVCPPTDAKKNMATRQIQVPVHILQANRQDAPLKAPPYITHEQSELGNIIVIVLNGKQPPASRETIEHIKDSPGICLCTHSHFG